MRTIAIAIILLLGVSACRGPAETPAPTPPSLDDADLATVVLTKKDMGKGWSEEKDPENNTVQIGGRSGLANIDDPIARATSAFIQPEGKGSGHVTNTVLLVRTREIADAVIASHRQAAAERSRWRQDRADGSVASFDIRGDVPAAAGLGEEVYTAEIDVRIEDGPVGDVRRNLQYVVYRRGHLVSFLVAQDVKVATFAKRQETRVGTLDDT